MVAGPSLGGLVGADFIGALVDRTQGDTPVFNFFLDGDARQTGAARGGPETGDASAILDQVKTVDSSKSKAILIKAAIDQMLGRGGSGKAAEPRTGEESAEPQAATSQTIAGEDLVRHLDAGGKAIRIEDGLLGVKGGRQKDEIDGREKVTFRAPERAAEGGSVTIGKLFNDGPDPGRQEQGVIKVYDGDTLVEEIQINGDTDGAQVVEIDEAFTRLEFSAKGCGSDFAIKDVTLNGAEAVETEEVTEVTETEVVEETSGSDDFLQNLGFNVLLQGLGRLAQVVDDSKLPEGAQTKLLDGLAGVIGLVSEVRDNGGDVRDAALTGIGSLVESLETSAPDGAGKNEVLDSLASLLLGAAKGSFFGGGALEAA